MSRTQRTVAAVLALLGGYLAAWPVGLEAVAWRAPRPPDATGRFAPNDDLASCEIFARMPGKGPDSLAIDAIGYVYTGLADGRVVRVSPDGERIAPVAAFDGRATGVAFDVDGNLLVTDERRGVLYLIEEDGTTVPLLRGFEGEPLMLVNDVAVGNDGTVYITESSTRYTLEQLRLEVLEHRPNGRILAYSPATRTVRVVQDRLYFPNGIAVTPDQAALVFVETTAYRISRYWLRGEKAGTKETLVENLPGFPGDVSVSESGMLWVSLVAPRSTVVDALSAWPRVRTALARLPAWMLPGPEPLPYLLEIDLDGRVARSLQTTRKDLPSFSSVIESEGSLYLGTPGIDASIDADAIYRIDLARIR